MEWNGDIGGDGTNAVWLRCEVVQSFKLFIFPRTEITMSSRTQIGISVMQELYLSSVFKRTTYFL